ncbi:MAG: hypothetical protein KGL46_05260 [Hyphomicrobiales bacterium]|nr:hypothetical protein [Hyphomicrobiales bacterium]
MQKPRRPEKPKDEGKRNGEKAEERRLEEGLKESFPASDPAAETQRGGPTSDEPPPKGQKTRR